MGKITKRSLAKEGSSTLSGGWSLFSLNKPSTSNPVIPDKTSDDPKEPCQKQQLSGQQEANI